MLVKYFANFRDITHKKREELKASNAAELLDILIEKYGDEFKNFVFNEQGELKPGVIFLVNGKNILHLKGLQTELKDDDEISLFPPAAGG